MHHTTSIWKVKKIRIGKQAFALYVKNHSLLLDRSDNLSSFCSRALQLLHLIMKVIDRLGYPAVMILS